MEELRGYVLGEKDGDFYIESLDDIGFKLSNNMFVAGITIKDIFKDVNILLSNNYSYNDDRLIYKVDLNKLTLSIYLSKNLDKEDVEIGTISISNKYINFEDILLGEVK